MSTAFIRKFEDNEISPEEIQHLEDWVKDDSYFKDYSIYKILRNEMLIRIYKYVPEIPTEEEIYDEHGIPYSAHKEKILPIGKIIALGEKCELGFQVGDTVCLPDGISLRQYNPDYLKWFERQDERPLPKGEQPPVFIYGLEKFNHMMFLKDKLGGFVDEDELTYLIPESLVKTGIKFNVE